MSGTAWEACVKVRPLEMSGMACLSRTSALQRRLLLLILEWLIRGWTPGILGLTRETTLEWTRERQLIRVIRETIHEMIQETILAIPETTCATICVGTCGPMHAATCVQILA